MQQLNIEKLEMFKQLLEHNITSCDGQYFCHLCMCARSSLEDVSQHIKEKEHRLLQSHQNVDILKDSKGYTNQMLLDNKIALIALNNFICMPCLNNFTDLISTLQHVRSKSHIERLTNCEKNKSKVHVSSVKSELLKVRRRKVDLSDESVLLKSTYTCKDHKCNIYVYEEQSERVSLDYFKIPYNYSNENCETLINNGIVKVEYHQLLCQFCHRCCLNLNDILYHITSKTHIFEVTKANMELKKGVSKQIQCVSIDPEITKDKMKSILPEAEKKNGNGALDLLQPITAKVQQGQNTNKEELLYNDLMCELCMCRLPSKDHILPHIRGKQHVSLLMKTIDENSDEDRKLDSAEKRCTSETVVADAFLEKSQVKNNRSILNEKLDSIEKTCVPETNVLSERSQTDTNRSNSKSNTECKICMSSCMNNCLKQCETLLNNKITVKDSNFVCTLCKRKMYTLHDTLQHIKGKSHVNKLQTSGVKCFIDRKSNSDGCADLKPTIDVSDNELNEMKIENRSNDHTTFDKFWLYCELCSIHVEIMNLYEHINTTIHKLDAVGISKEDDKLLFKCFCCKSIMQGSRSLGNHLNSTKHLNNLINTLKNIKTNTTEASTKRTSEDTNSSLCSVLFPEIENVTEICFIFFDTSNVQICDNVKNKIIYYCSVCRAILNTDHNLTSHCQAGMHVRKLKHVLSGNNDSNVEIGEKEIIKISDKSFDITDDICAEIAQVLHVSPLRAKSAKESKPKESKVVKRLNKIYCERYLEIEDKMFTIDEKRLHDTELNFKPFMPHSKQHFYCLVCDAEVSKEFDILYEHACLKRHKIYVNTIVKDEYHTKLMKEYMQIMSKDTVKCHICKSDIKNDTNSIDNHINDDAHKKKCKSFCATITSIFNFVIKQYYNNLWYSIQKYSCVLCQTNFKYKIEFIEHIIAKHDRLLEKQIFDFCIPCATLWLNNTDCYTEHCNDIMHKYLIKSKDFMVEALPECIKKLLEDVDKTSNILLQQTQILMNDNIQEEVTRSLENIFKPYYSSVKAFLFGSRITGLGSANSDIDIYLDYGNTYYTNQEECLRRKHFKHIVSILRKQKKEWEIKEVIEESRTPVIKLLYKRTGVQCDISITNGLSVENSKLIRSFNDAYPPCRKLILFVRKWLSCFNLPARHGLINYAVGWLVIFYLQVNSHLPSVAALIKEENKSRLICGWETGVAKPKNDNKSVQSVATLLLGFFQFYANFDYRYNIVCPLMGRILAKKTFIELYTLPKEMKPYINHLYKSNDPEYLRIDSPLCVQDPFDLSHNLTKAVSSITLKYFKQYCHNSASILNSMTK